MDGDMFPFTEEELRAIHDKAMGTPLYYDVRHLISLVRRSAEAEAAARAEERERCAKIADNICAEEQTLVERRVSEMQKLVHLVNIGKAGRIATAIREGKP